VVASLAESDILQLTSGVGHDDLSASLRSHPDVEWFELQTAQTRVKKASMEN
jgi:hypothetical protein